MRTPSRPSLPIAGLVAAAALVAPAAARAAPDATATSTVAGAPAFVAWADGTEVRVAGPGGAGERVVARLDDEDDIAGTRLSADGRRLAILTRDGVRVADLVGGGPLRVLARGRSGGRHVSWSPDGRKALVVDDERLLRCDLTVAPPCRRIGGKPADGSGATFSPDATRVVYLRAQPLGADRGDEPLGDVVVVDRGGRSRVFDRARSTRRSVTLVVDPVWTTLGLAWSAVDVGLSQRGDDLRVLRTRTRAAATVDGPVRTIASARPASPVGFPFIVASGTPGGAFAGVGIAPVKGDADRSAVTLQTLAPAGGAPAPTGIAYESEDETSTFLGLLPDGRAAFTRGEEAADTVRLVLLSPGGAPAGDVVTGDAVSIATPYPASRAGEVS